ncbi:WD repeat-containing protein 96 [Eufriesea mexicana]|uniref:Cilia- and flagella-associated protein 43 n=1 Tax=Eufriesea mexicana TaxID=516756 RepID=A0A310SC67_9HYME|nr:WD repeat-containing protein 96 [Eufriesea mexicana]
MASGVHVRFLEHRTGETRIERFDGGERGDGACRVAGHSVAPIFSVVERKANPWISVLAYPTMRRISRCAESRRANGYSCCAFVGTEYLLGQATFPDFCLTVWHWRTGERLTVVNGPNATTLGMDRATIACPTDSARLVARFAPSTGTLSVYRVLACSNTVRLFPLDVRFERRPVSCSWSTAGTLLYYCDQHGNVCSVDLDEDQRDRGRDRTIVRVAEQAIPWRNPALVGHSDGVLVFGVNDADRERDVRATFYRKPWKDENDEWRATWTIPLRSYPRHAVSDPRRDGILILGEDGNLYEMVWESREHTPRLECLLWGDVHYATIVPLPGRYLGALDRADGLTIVDATTGKLVSSSTRLAHHVADLTSHPTSPILASCSEAGNCLFVDACTPSCPRTTHCVHLQREPLDRVKFSDRGCLLGVSAIRIGRLFLLSTSPAEPRVAAWLNLGRKVLDFLIHETDDDDVAKTLILVGNDESSNSRIGNEILEYACRWSERSVYREDADRSTKLPSSFERVHRGKGSSREMIGIPYLSKQLHRIELKEDPREGAFLVEALPSLHQTRGIEITVQRGKSSCLLTCGFDGLIVGRDHVDPRRVFALLVAHHRSEGGGRRAVLVGHAIISLGRNGDLVANGLPCRRIERNDRSSRSTGSARRVTPDRLETGKTDPPDATHFVETQEEAETWVERTVHRRSMVEQKRALASRLSLLRDWTKLKRQITTLLDSNETAPPNQRLPISAFDLDRASRELAFEAMEKRLYRDAEEQIARQDRTSRYIRDRFLDPLVVRPRSVFSLFGRSRVTNYPLAELASQDRRLAAWSRFSMKTRQLVSRLEDEDNPCTLDVENPWSSCHGFVEVSEACAIAEFREREIKERFDERFEQTRTAKQKEITAANDRAKEVRRLVRELRCTFHVDASSKLLEAPEWHPTEREEDAFDVDASQREQPDDDDDDDDDPEVEAKVEEFRRNALDEMMDGALEVRLEDNAKRNIPMPECLRSKDPFDYTEEDARAIESYEKKIRARESDREKYRSTLESDIERITEEFSRSAKIFDDELNELSCEKIRVERSILQGRLSALRTIVRHREIVEERREVERAIESELAPATKETRELCEQCDLFEAGVAEARIGYENARKRDRQLEGKFRGELVESKPSMTEYLFRQYRKRPALSGTHGACGASVAFLAELASCLIEERTSDVLPAECSSYLRAVNHLDAMPDGPSRRPELDHWRLTCRLRRLKMEAETKVKSCAIELAEAEQSLTFLRKACTFARDKVDRCKRTIELRQASLEADSSTDRDVALTLKTGQLRMRGKGCPFTDWEDAVPTPVEEVTRANRAIQEAERRRSDALRKLAKVQELVSLEEWRHELEKTRMEDLLVRARDLDLVKVRLALFFQLVLEIDPSPSLLFLVREKMVSVSRFHWESGATRRKRASESERLVTEIRTWRRRNDESTRKTERSTIEREQLVLASRDPLRLRVAAFRASGARALRRKARLAARIRDNLQQLSILETRLETCKLRTYPTLKLKF